VNPFFNGMPSSYLEVGNDGVKIIASQPEGHAVALQESPIVVPGEPGVVHLVASPAAISSLMPTSKKVSIIPG
jgi:hypothetical protein